MKLAKLILMTSIVLVFTSCGETTENKTADSHKGEETTVENSETAQSSNSNGHACDYLSEEYIRSKFPNAENIKPHSSDSPYPTCSYIFQENGEHYTIGLTIARAVGDVSMLETSMSFIKMDKTALEGFGEKAYYIPKLGQISLYQSGNLIHVNCSDGLKNTGREALAKEIAKELLSKMN
ncbi:MAG: hypothetical protein N4A35_16515 [Flavobacteriales bacterium]|jgi:hypothetical protein|nr:hypothetical protein [Flavobacteriales bacterium]